MLTTDNFRKLRRYLQGAGVNFRETIVTGKDNDPDIGTRTPVAGLKDDDGLVSIINLTDNADQGSDLAMEKAYSVSIFATNKGVKYTGRKAGDNSIYIKYAANTSGNDGHVAVTVAPYLVGKTLITVELSTTAAKNTAALVQVNVLENQDAAKIVDAALVGTGATQITATGPHQLGATVTGDVSASVVGYLRTQGATRSSLVTDLALDADGLDPNLRYDAVVPGAVGSQGDAQITVEYVSSGGAVATTTVAVAGTDITVTLRRSASATLATGDEIAAAIQADADASALVSVKPAHGTSAPGVADAFNSYPGPGTGADVAGGQDAGIVLAADRNGDAIKVAWVTRGNAS